MSGIFSAGGAGAVGASGSFYPVTIDDSLRFNDNDSPRLSLDPIGSPTDAKKVTISFWLKRGNLGSTQYIFTGEQSNIYYDLLWFDTNNKFNVTGQENAVSEGYITTAVFKDTSAFYHFVVELDSTLSTAADRVKIYVNGILQDKSVRSGYTAYNQNHEFYYNKSGNSQNIGRSENYGTSFDGYLSDIYFIDGQALDPTDFGEAKDGTWIPKSYSGSYGTNGFHLEFNGNTNDTSGNGNNFTANNISAHDYVPDTPTNKFAVLNPLANVGSGSTLSEGNLQAAYGSGRGSSPATMGMPEGKWYWEATITATSTVPPYCMIGISLDSFGSDIGVYPGANSRGYGYYGLTGDKYNVSSATYGDTFTTGDIIGVAFDNDNGTLTFYKNGVSQGVAYSGLTQNVYFPVIADVSTTQTFTIVTNFGQDSTFAGATTAGGNTDANGVGDFKYAPPAGGFLAICSANLPDSTIGLGQTALAEDYFVPYIYTADGTSPKSRTGLGFSPDFLWFKDRTVALSHALYDTIRGPNKGLQTNSTSAENSYNALNSFDADGFTTITDGTVGNLLNNSTDSYVTWAWKAGGTPTATNSAGAGAVPTSGSVLIDGAASTAALAGTIAANKITANTEAGFSLINYTGNGLSGQTVAHGLSSTPEFLIHKDRGTNSNNGQWNAWHKYAGDGDDYGYLSVTNAFTGDSQIIPNGTDTIELKANLTTTNQSGHSFIMYAFHSVEGYSKVGSFDGNSNVDGAFVYTGFRPSFVLFRSAAISANWYIIDNKRDPHNVATKYLRPAITNTEGSLDFVDFLSNGFKLRSSSTEINGTNVIYLAFAETPFKYANAR